MVGGGKMLPILKIEGRWGSTIIVLSHILSRARVKHERK